MKILYSGFDAIDFSVKGALPAKILNQLEVAKAEAEKRQGVVLLKAGPGDVTIHVHESGLRGGFTFRISTGPTGEIVGIKSSTDPEQWNFTVSIRAASLATKGWRTARQDAWDLLKGLGVTVTDHSVRRVDYAIDVRIPVWDLRLESFVAHPRSTVRPHWGKKQAGAADEFAPQTVTKGRRLSTVTVGKMPGRQIIVYDKKAAAIEKRELFWFDLWKLPRKLPDLEIARIELRAGKSELKDKWQIRTFEDMENAIGDVFEKLTSDIRYLSPNQSDSNISRQRADPLWGLVRNHLAHILLEMRSGLTPDQVKQQKRTEAIRTHEDLILGNAASLAVAKGLSEQEAISKLPLALKELCENALNSQDGKFYDSMRKAGDRVHFIT